MATPARRTIVCDIGALSGHRPDVALVDALARLQLVLRRYSLEIVLRDAPAELVELIGFAGLADVLCVEPRGQTEERKERRGVEEERELDDLPG
jgi:hypothetical protein